MLRSSCIPFEHIWRVERNSDGRSNVTRGPFAAVFFPAFVVLNQKLREWITGISPGAVSSTIPVGPRGETEEVDELHAFAAFTCFLAAVIFNVNCALWSPNSSRRHLNLQVAFISAVAAFTHWWGRHL